MSSAVSHEDRLHTAGLHATRLIVLPVIVKMRIAQLFLHWRSPGVGNAASVWGEMQNSGRRLQVFLKLSSFNAPRAYFFASSRL